MAWRMEVKMMETSLSKIDGMIVDLGQSWFNIIEPNHFGYPVTLGLP
jgi:hypothetical protein